MGENEDCKEAIRREGEREEIVNLGRKERRRKDVRMKENVDLKEDKMGRVERTGSANTKPQPPAPLLFSCFIFSPLPSLPPLTSSLIFLLLLLILAEVMQSVTKAETGKSPVTTFVLYTTYQSQSNSETPSSSHANSILPNLQYTISTSINVSLYECISSLILSLD